MNTVKLTCHNVEQHLSRYDNLFIHPFLSSLLDRSGVRIFDFCSQQDLLHLRTSCFAALEETNDFVTEREAAVQSAPQDGSR